METKTEMMADSARSRSTIYGLLTAVFREEPSETFINELRDPRMSGVFSEMRVELGDSFYSSSGSELTEDLGVEFARLFIGPGSHISAHESVFTKNESGAGALWGERTVRVKKFIETAGLVYEPKFTGIPDHISVELEFMQKLSEWEAEKWQEDDSDGANYCLGVQKKFVDEHLSQWASNFCEQVIEEAELPFYREMSKVTKAFLEADQQSIDGALLN